ncbi:MAG: Malonyl CoA-acyl carrier protein transacylase [Candidatus Omnitrophica bacterium]|nr:Malonyl CoA-acyl carrier protein transacylase [Candidatus Omnitrophota bacterium]
MTRAAWLFPGQGSQYVGMGKDLYDAYPQARAIFDRAQAIVDFDLKAVCFEGPADKISQTRYSQPAIFVTSIAALEVFKAHSHFPRYAPAFAAGLSLGEATALVAAGAIGYEDGVRFVMQRGRFMEEAAAQNPGMMAAVLGTDLSVVEKVCAETGAEVGNLNAPGQIVISGHLKKVEDAIEGLRAAGAKRVIPLDVSGAFHSSCMDPACERIAKALASVPIAAPGVPVVSNLTADVEASPEDIRGNLVRQMNHRTLWEDSVRMMIGEGIRVFFELGPGKVLKGLLKKIDAEAQCITLGTVEDFNELERS